jgi:hypothetical protein
VKIVGVQKSDRQAFCHLGNNYKIGDTLNIKDEIDLKHVTGGGCVYIVDLPPETVNINCVSPEKDKGQDTDNNSQSKDKKSSNNDQQNSKESKNSNPPKNLAVELIKVIYGEQIPTSEYKTVKTIVEIFREEYY